ncbi:MAG: trigger factor [Acidobacteria bacterium]|nr:trigger factor [Acidobacteriota bacterium]
METRVETLSSVTRKLVIELKPDEMNEQYGSIVKEFKKIAKIPGFRKNKAPLHLIEARYRKEIDQEIIRFIANEKYPEAVETVKDELGKIIREEIINYKMDPDHSVSAEFYVEVLPEFELKDMDTPTLTIPKQEKKPEETIKNVLADLQQQHAEIKPVDRETAEAGDFVELKLNGVDKNGNTVVQNEELKLELSEEGYFAPVVPEIIGMKIGEEKTFSVTYPEEEQFGMLKGETISYTATVNRIMEKTVPELNDDFAKKIGKFETLAELEEDIRKNLMEKYEQAERAAKQRAVMDYLLSRHEFEVPPILIHEEARKMTEDYFSQLARYGLPPEKDEEKIRAVYEQNRTEAEQRVKEGILLGRFAEKYEVKADEAEINNTLAKIAAGFGGDVPVEKVRKVLEEKDEMENIESKIRQDKVFDILLSNAAFEEKEMSKENSGDDTADEKTAEKTNKKTAAETASEPKEKTEETNADSDGD